MPRTREPEELAKLKGADKKNPQRYRGKTPKNSRPLTEPPPGFSAAEKKIWYELLENAIPEVLTAADFPVMEQAASLLYEFRQLRKQNRAATRNLKKWQRELDELKQQFRDEKTAKGKAAIKAMVKEHRLDKPRLEFWPSSRIAQLHALIAKLGMTPVDRQRLRVPENNERPGQGKTDDDDFLPLNNVH